MSLRKLCFLIAVVALGCILPRSAAAKDLCITLQGTNPAGSLLVGRNFHVPNAGKCAPWNGFAADKPRSTLIGVGCTSSDGARLSINMRYVSAPDVGNPNPIDAFDLGVRLDLPILAGGYQYSFPSSGGGSGAAAIACKKVAIP